VKVADPKIWITSAIMKEELAQKNYSIIEVEGSRPGWGMRFPMCLGAAVSDKIREVRM
jgi:hypothetical protein